MSEIRIHRSLHHTNVVAFEHFFEDSENVYILLEMCQNQTLNELLKRRKRLDELEVQSYLLQIIASVKYLHSHRVIHRDLKLGNLFLTDKMELKIGDFGLATRLEFDGDRKRTICGTPNYIAPEILDGKQGHSYEVDVWALGVIIYTLIIGKPPFETSDVKTTYRKIKMNAYSFPETIPISDQAKNLITKILNLDPSKRPTLDEILDHQFFHMGIGIPKLLPTSSLACPLSASYKKQYLHPNQIANTLKINTKLESTAPNQIVTSTRAVQKNIPIVSEKISKNDIQPMLMTAKPNVISGHSRDDKIKNVDSKDSKKQNTQNAQIYVKKWVDYSSKYGLGYLLSNNATGVFFNDSTKIILEPKGHHFDYIERKGADKQDVIVGYTLTDYPKDLHKKVTLLQHFRSYLESDSKSKTQTLEEESVQKSNSNAIYVKKWMRTRHAIMFRLSNRIVQVSFQDKTEIILSSESREVTYVNKKGERLSYPLTAALDSANEEMKKRLKYTKDILTHMLNANQQPNPHINAQIQNLPEQASEKKSNDLNA